MDILRELKAKWLELGIRSNAGLAEATIHQFEKKHSLRLPALFRSYLITLNGMPEDEVDHEMIAFLSLDSIDNDSHCFLDESGDAHIVFADFSVGSHVYMLKLDKRGQNEAGIIVSAGEQRKILHRSFDAFLTAYLDNPKEIAYCWT